MSDGDDKTVVDEVRSDPKRRRAIVAVGFATAVVAGVAIALPVLFGSGDGGDAPGDAAPAPGQGWAVACAQATGRAAMPAQPVNPTGAAVPPVRPMPAEPPAVRPTPETITATAVPLPYTGPLPTPLPTDPPVATKPPLASAPATKRVETLTQYACPTGGAGMPAVPPERPRSANAWPPPNVTPVHYSAEQLQQRGVEMQAQLAAALAMQVPSAMEINGALAAGQDSLRGVTEFTADGVRFSLEVTVFAPGAPGSPAPGQDECLKGECHVESTPDGGLRASSFAKSDGVGLLAQATDYRANGTVVRFTLTHRDPQVRSSLADPSVSTGLLTTLAADPKLGL